MVNIHDIPPEILAAAFEIGIYSIGISFLRPLAKVCQDWRDIIDHTPRLWGILFIGKRSSPDTLARHITKAKASPLSIMVAQDAQVGRHKKVVKQLIDLSSNWVSAEVGTEFISGCRRLDLHSLEVLSLSVGRPIHDDPGSFFEGVDDFTKRQAKLHFFTAIGLPRSWIVGFIGPTIHHFCLVGGKSTEIDPRARHDVKITDTWYYISCVSEAISIDLQELKHSLPHAQSLPIISLRKLCNLRLKSVLHALSILSSIAAPSLQTLSSSQRLPPSIHAWRWSIVTPFFHCSPPMPMAPFFTKWSEPGFVPTHLHTLELIDCLEVSDIPYLIRWMARLPNLVRLFLRDDFSRNVLGIAAAQVPSDDEETNLYKALAFPIVGENGQPTWLCPSLMIFYLDADQGIKDLVSIARARGGISSPTYGLPPPNRLRRIEAHLCGTGEQEEIEMLRSLIDNAYCICTHCGLNV